MKSVAAARTRLYVSALVQAGASAKDDAYSINNAASLSSGGVALPGESSASFKPSIPVMAEKSDATTPQGGLETQSASFTVKAGASVVVDYTLTVDRAAYVAAGGDLDGVVTFRNAFAVSTADGSTAEDSSTGKVKVQPDVSKKGVVSSGKSEDGNPLINWSVDVRLQQIFGAVELSDLETASVKDELDQRLKYLGVSVEDSRTTIAGTTTTPLEEGRDYEASFDEATRTLEAKIKNPSEHPDVRVTIKTEVVGSVDGIGNSVDVFVDGQYKGGDKTEIKDDLVDVSLMVPATLPARTGTRLPRSRPMSLLRSIRRKSRILLTLRRPLRLLAMRTCFPKRGTALRRLCCSRSLSAVWDWRQSPDACAGSDGSVLSHEKSMQRARA